jgi:hypothetical protein
MNLLSKAAAILLYFAAGCSHDFLVAKYYLYLSSHQRVRAAVFTVLIDFFGYAIMMVLVMDKNFVGALSFALGTGLGTWVAMGKKKEKLPDSGPR